MLTRSKIKQIEFEHMQGTKQPVLEICPKTGEYIEAVEIPKKLTINHFFKKLKNLPDEIQYYRNIGVKNLTDEQIDEVYKLVKEHKACKIV